MYGLFSLMIIIAVFLRDILSVLDFVLPLGLAVFSVVRQWWFWPGYATWLLLLGIFSLLASVADSVGQYFQSVFTPEILGSNPAHGHWSFSSSFYDLNVLRS